MTRGLAALVVVAAVLASGCSATPERATERDSVDVVTASNASQVGQGARLQANDGPNLLVVTMDDMRWDELRFAPNARRYVLRRGLRFANSFAPNPLCCPSRASFLTGQHSHNHRVYSHESPYGFGVFDDRLTLGTALNRAGYRTAMVGKYLNGYGDQNSRVTGGSSVTYVPNGWTDWKAGVEKRWPAGSRFAGGTYNYFAFTQNVNGRVVSNRGRYSSAVIGAQVRGLVEKYDAGRSPWFIWVNPVAPHFGGPEEADDPPPHVNRGMVSHFLTPARPDWVKGRFDVSVQRAPGVRRDGRPSERNISDKPAYIQVVPELDGPDRRGLAEVERQRAESIFAWDRQFGSIIATLKRTGQLKGTVIAFTSDNGYLMGEHRLKIAKIAPHEPSLRVPLVMAGPGIPHGVRYAPATNIDLTATLLDLGGARLPHVDGASRVPLFGGDQPWTVPVLTESRLPFMAHVVDGFPAGLTQMGLRTGRYAFFRYSTGAGELYDLAKDPLQLRNKFRDPSYRSVRLALGDLWRRYRRCVGDECRVPLPAAYRVSTSKLAELSAKSTAARVRYYG